MTGMMVSSHVEFARPGLEQGNSKSCDVHAIFSLLSSTDHQAEVGVTGGGGGGDNNNDVIGSRSGFGFNHVHHRNGTDAVEISPNSGTGYVQDLLPWEMNYHEAAIFLEVRE